MISLLYATAKHEYDTYFPNNHAHTPPHTHTRAPPLPHPPSGDHWTLLVNPDAYMWTYAYTPAAVAFLCTAIALGGTVLAAIAAAVSSSPGSSSGSSLWAVAFAPFAVLTVFCALARVFHVLRWVDNEDTKYTLVAPAYYLVGGAGIVWAITASGAGWVALLVFALVAAVVYLSTMHKPAYMLLAYPAFVCLFAGVVLLIQWDHDGAAIVHAIGYLVLLALRVASSDVFAAHPGHETSAHFQQNHPGNTPAQSTATARLPSVLLSLATWDAVFVAYTFTVVVYMIVVDASR
jgi:hypothetical protein